MSEIGILAAEAVVSESELLLANSKLTADVFDQARTVEREVTAAIRTLPFGKSALQATNHLLHGESSATEIAGQNFHKLENPALPELSIANDARSALANSSQLTHIHGDLHVYRLPSVSIAEKLSTEVSEALLGRGQFAGKEVADASAATFNQKDMSAVQYQGQARVPTVDILYQDGKLFTGQVVLSSDGRFAGLHSAGTTFLTDDTTIVQDLKRKTVDIRLTNGTGYYESESGVKVTTSAGLKVTRLKPDSFAYPKISITPPSGEERIIGLEEGEYPYIKQFNPTDKSWATEDAWGFKRRDFQDRSIETTFPEGYTLTTKPKPFPPGTDPLTTERQPTEETIDFPGVLKLRVLSDGVHEYTLPGAKPQIFKFDKQSWTDSFLGENPAPIPDGSKDISRLADVQQLGLEDRSHEFRFPLSNIVVRKDPAGKWNLIKS